MITKHMTELCLIALLSLGLPAPALAEESPAEWEKVVFHVDEMANARWALTLAHSYLDDSPKAKIVFVAYGPGIDFLLEDATDHLNNPYDDAEMKLVDRGVEFRVCATTLSSREVAKADFLEEVLIVPSGVSEIARLQLKEAYAYLKP